MYSIKNNYFYLYISNRYLSLKFLHFYKNNSAKIIQINNLNYF